MTIHPASPGHTSIDMGKLVGRAYCGFSTLEWTRSSLAQEVGLAPGNRFAAAART